MAGSGAATAELRRQISRERANFRRYPSHRDFEPRQGGAYPDQKGLLGGTIRGDQGPVRDDYGLL